MKKALLSVILLILSVAFTSCSNGGDSMPFGGNNNEKIAEKTLKEILSAISMKDESKIVDLFSNSIKNDDDLSQSAMRFVDFIHGDIISFSSASDAGVGADYKNEAGKKRKEIQSAFCINTTQSTYYIAIKECVKDEFDDNNVGIVSIYIIESNYWTESYVYRGDGKWIRGINIVEPLKTN